MEEKVIKFKDDEWRWFTEKTVVYKPPNKKILMYESSLSCSPSQTYIPKISEEKANILPPQHMGIVDSGATHLYIEPNAQHGPLDTRAATIEVGTTNGQVATSAEKAILPIPQLAADFSTMGYIIPAFTNMLIGVGPIFDTNCIVVFHKIDVTELSP